MLEINKIYHGDCLEVIKQIPDKSIDLVLTDPPYNISDNVKMTKMGNKFVNADFGEWDKMGRDEYLLFCGKVLSEICRILKDNSGIYWFTDKAMVSYIWDIGVERGLKGKNIIVWHKNNPVPQFRFQNYLSSCEFFIWFAYGVHKLNFGKQTEMHNFIEMPICSDRDRIHPTQKPVKLFETYIKHGSNENDLVLDPFSGSGTTAIACHNLKRNFICIEKDEEYYKKSVERYNKHIQQTRLW